MTGIVDMTPRCIYCKEPIRFMEVSNGKEVYKCKCGLSDHTKPEIK